MREIRLQFGRNKKEKQFKWEMEKSRKGITEVLA